MGMASVVERNVALARELAPARDVGLDELAELVGLHRHRVDRVAGEALLERRRGKRPVDLRVELLRDLGGHLRRTYDAVPLHRVEAAEAGFFEGGNIGQQGMAHETGDGDRLHLLRADGWKSVGEAGEHNWRLYGQDSAECADNL